MPGRMSYLINNKCVMAAECSSLDLALSTGFYLIRKLSLNS